MGGNTSVNRACTDVRHVVHCCSSILGAGAAQVVQLNRVRVVLYTMSRGSSERVIFWPFI